MHIVAVAARSAQRVGQGAAPSLHNSGRFPTPELPLSLTAPRPVRLVLLADIRSHFLSTCRVPPHQAALCKSHHSVAHELYGLFSGSMWNSVTARRAKAKETKELWLNLSMDIS